MLNKLYEEMYKQEEYYWWHLGKRNAVKDLLSRYFTSQKKIKIFDVGCGTGMMLQELKKYYPESEVWGIDSSDQAINFCQKRGFNFIKKADLSVKLP